MSIEMVSIVILGLIFVVSAIFSLNIGILAFVTSFILMLLSPEINLDELYESFPVNLFVLLFGITYLFTLLEKNDTLSFITKYGISIVKGNVGLIPWVIFGIATILTAVGTAAIAVASILAGIGFKMAYENKINPLLIGLMILTGIMAGSFSPINIFGIIVNGVMKSEELTFSHTGLFLNNLIFYTIMSFIVFFIFGGFKLLRDANSQTLNIVPNSDIQMDEKIKLRPSKQNIISIIGLILLITFVIAYDIDIGFGALTLALGLSLLTPKIQGEALSNMPWSPIIMVSGMVTFIGIMEQVGAIDLMQNLIGKIGNPLLAALIASFVGAIIATFASTTGFLSAIIPLVVPLLSEPGLSSTGVLSALTISSSIVDISPFSTVGALFLANVQGIKIQKFFIQLLLTAAILILIGPIVSWLIFVVLGSLF